MCGLSGFMGGGGDPAASEAVLQKMGETLFHRGPDSGGYWYRAEHQIGLAHRRLSILDPSPQGHQPMVSASGRFVLVFNGEIYNHLNLRKELLATGNPISFKGHSDTETLLACFEAWGVKNTLVRAVGMFAIAMWDQRDQQLMLARDRLGEKPLYYGWQGHGDQRSFLFASELKSLLAHPTFRGTIDRNALCLQLRHSCIPAPYSIYEGLFKLEPGSILTVSLNDRQVRIEAYWSAAQAAFNAAQRPFQGSLHEGVHELDVLLRHSISQQMVADVPLGAFLSGGVDSSSIVALMQAQSGARIKTFTIGFHEQSYNEAIAAKEVANHLGTDHTELYISAKEALSVIPLMPDIYDEPFSDASQIPTFLVSRLARQHVTVALSGDGGDEVFAGYNRYQITSQLWRDLERVPRPLRRVLAKCLTTISPDGWNSFFSNLGLARGGLAGVANLGDKLHKGAAVLSSSSVDELYRGLVSHWKDPASVVIGGREPATLLTDGLAALHGVDGVSRMMALDALTYLPDDVLFKVDRAAMSVSLETRIPFLDHRVLEFAWCLPMDMKLGHGQTKLILRKLLEKYIPKDLIERPKMGFSVPIDSWLRGPLRDWAESLLDPVRLKNEGYFHPAPIREKWTQHLSGARNWAEHLWDILMFQAWLERTRQ